MYLFVYAYECYILNAQAVRSIWQIGSNTDWSARCSPIDTVIVKSTSFIPKPPRAIARPSGGVDPSIPARWMVCINGSTFSHQCFETALSLMRRHHPADHYGNGDRSVDELHVLHIQHPDTIAVTHELQGETKGSTRAAFQGQAGARCMFGQHRSFGPFSRAAMSILDVDRTKSDMKRTSSHAGLAIRQSAYSGGHAPTPRLHLDLDAAGPTGAAAAKAITPSSSKAATARSARATDKP